MGRLIKKTSFTGGEVDIALLERSNLEKVQSGLEDARNVIIGKNGRILNRNGTIYNRLAKSNSGNSVLVEIPNTDYLLEVTAGNIRKHTMSTGSSSDIATSYSEADVLNLHFAVASKYLGSTGNGEVPRRCVYIFLENSQTFILDLITDNYITMGFQRDFDATYRATLTLTPVGAPAGPEVEYAVTVVYPNGEESVLHEAGFVTPLLPVASGQYNEFTILTFTGVFVPALEYRFYRRPKNGGAFGYIGSSFDKVWTGTSFRAKFQDYGQSADYSVLPPTYLTSSLSTGLDILYPKTGAVVQGRLLMGNVADYPEYIYASRTNYPWNFTRDYPLSDDSGLLFKSGQTGAAEVLRIADGGTTVVWTAVGIYANTQQGPITPYNNNLRFVSSAIIDERVPPLRFGDIILFVDVTDNSIKRLDFSNNRQNYASDDLTVFSGHLFQGKRIVSWVGQKYGDPIVWCTMDDGSVVSLTLNPSQELQAFTRHDFINGEALFVSSYGIGSGSRIVFLVERNGVRTFETLSERYLTPDKELCFVDAAVQLKKPLHALLGQPLASLGLTYTPVDADLWTGNVRLNSIIDAFDSSMIDKIYRQFNDLGEAIDFKCISVPSAKQAIFTKNPENPYDEVDESYWEDIELFETFTQMTGLSHLNNENVSVYIDGGVKSSPLNNQMNYPNYTPVLGVLNIPRAAYCTVGLPYVWDVGTFEVTAQDAETALRAKITGKAYVRTHKSKGFYVGPSFPDDDSITGMQPNITYEVTNPTNSASPPKTERYGVTITNDWKTNGRVCLRGVDPVPFELLSIIADLTLT